MKDYSIQEVSLNDPINLSPAPDGSKTLTVSDPQFPVHHNLRTLSYSGILTLHNCPRKFELNRMMPRVRVFDDDAGHLSFGTVVGNGIQEYLVSGSINAAYMRIFMDWKESLDEDKAEKINKSVWHAFRALDKFVIFRHTVLSSYEIAYFQGKPAIELGFDIDCGEGFHYRGKIDALLIHKIKKEYLVLECKTTGINNVDEAMYKNSSQALGYGLVIDRVAFESGLSNNYSVLYPVYKTKQFEWQEFMFPKSPVQRATWLQTILLDVSRIQEYNSIEYFPLYGESCFSFGRQCAYFGMCGLSNEMILGDPSLIELKLDKDEDYALKFNIAQLIEAQMER